MLQHLQNWFSGNFMAHGYCYLWKPQLVWLHAGSDFLIALSYYSIPLLLVYFVHQRKDLPFQGIFLLFSAFILSCGTTHLAEIWTLWYPDYWLSGLLKAITAIISLYTASELLPLLPKALALPSPAQLEAVNLALENEITQHKQTVKALLKSQQRLSLLIQQTPLAIIEWNLNSQVSEWNPAAEELFGYKKSEVIGYHATELMMPGCTKEQFNNFWHSLLSSPNGSCSTHEYQTQNGNILYCEWHNIPLIEPNATVIGVASLVQNITQQKEAEKAILQVNEELEQRVELRTKELAKANEILQAEIIERKQAESALWENKKRLHIVVNQAPIILYATDNHGVITVLEGKGLEGLGYQPNETNHSVSNLDLSNFKILENLPEVLRGNDQAYLVKVGSSVYHNRVTPIRNQENQVIGLIGVATDITIRYQTQLALAERERYLAILVKVQHQLLAIKHEENYYTAVVELLGQASCADHVYVFEQTRKNQQSFKQCAYWYDSLKNENNTQKCQKNPYEEGIHHWIQRLRNSEAIFGLVSELSASEKLILEQHGILSLLILPLIIKEQFFGFVVFDCTEAKVWTEVEVDLLRAATTALSLQHERSQTEIALRRQESKLRAQTAQLEQTLTQLKQAQAQLVQSEKMSSLGLMVAGIAHEINNPVSFIYGNLTPAREYTQQLSILIQLYQQHYPIPPTEIQTYIEDIELNFLIEDLPNLLNSMKVGAERIRDLVLALRIFSRIDEAKMKQVNIHECLESTLLLLKHQLQEKPGHKGIEVIKKYGNVPAVQCYPGQLNQVFTNILSNAIDALDSKNLNSPENLTSTFSPHIEIFTEIVDSIKPNKQNTKSVLIKIIDNGIGMTERVKQRLFDPFFTTKPVGKGTGLGLSISYQIIVAEHGGQLKCLSSPGKGSELIIQIPIHQPVQKSLGNQKHLESV
jgi:PAS domain S-box-containing protein